MRAFVSFVALMIPLCIAGCTGSDDTASPTPDPGSSAAPGAAAPGAAPLAGATGAAQQQPGTTPASPTTPSNKPDASKADAGVTDAGIVDSGVADSGKADASAPDAGTGAAKMRACIDKCQPIMQSCLTPTFTDAGIPKVKDPKLCQAELDKCRAACTP